MKILLFTTRNCAGCLAWFFRVEALAVRHALTLKTYDIDDPKHFSMNLAAMRKYALVQIPGTVFVDEHGVVITTVGGWSENAYEILEKSVIANCEKI